uniref:AAA family ATPase n=1 Tax=Caloramator sp. Dgby_cultured_2 TaxID=3029174 RepID=UPI0031584477
MKRRIPLGISDFKSLIIDEYYFVDKSLFVKEILEDGAQVLLFARPRRFGKTLNMSMLKYFLI